MKLRLLMLEECNRRCKGCCNKDWDLVALPKITDFSKYEIVMLTGGEPMLYPEQVVAKANEVRAQSAAEIFVYTAKVDDINAALAVLNAVDGMTVTLHTKKDIPIFKKFDAAVKAAGLSKKLRLNVFKNVSKFYSPTEDTLSRWAVKDDITWIKDCPLPEGEVMGRV